MDRYILVCYIRNKAPRKEAGWLAVKHGILGILARRPCHGYELKTEFDQLTAGLWDLNIGQIYSTLERLRKDGWVALDAGPGAEDERKVYRITAAGRAQLAAWLESPPLKPRPVRDEVYVRLALLLEGRRAAASDLLADQRRVYHTQLAVLTRQKLALARSEAPDRLRRELMLDAAILHVEADLKWLDTCEDKLRARPGPTRRQL